MSTSVRGFDSVFRRTRAVFWAFQAAPFATIAVLFYLRSLERRGWFEEQPSLQYVIVAVLALASLAQLRVRETVARRTAEQSRSRGESAWEAQAAAELARMALNEVIAIHGLVAFLITANLWLALPFMLLGRRRSTCRGPRKTAGGIPPRRNGPRDGRVHVAEQAFFCLR